jgi:transcriptional regulator with XRE-family HTH domain
VKELRQSLGLTQEQLAIHIADITDGLWDPAPKELLRLEGGQRLVVDLEILVLSRAFSCSPLFLLTGEQENT